jgi:hypothetical protein
MPIRLSELWGREPGRFLRLSPQRRFVCDLLSFAQRVPSVPMQRRMQLGELIAARATWTHRPSWCAIFLKAYSRVAAEYPELRRAYMPLPWAHLYEHPSNVATFSVERDYQGEPGVFFTQIHRPEDRSLAELDEIVRFHKQVDVDRVPKFRLAMFLSRLPRPIRRFVWWLGLRADGARRAQFFGTFGISVVASLGAAGLHILSPLTSTVNYGTFDEQGGIDVRVVYDHRVLDGATMARAMVTLEDVLLGEILDELRAGRATPGRVVPLGRSLLAGSAPSPALAPAAAREALAAS